MKSLVMLAAILAGCGGHGDPVDAEGMWTVALTNRDNDCNVQGWNAGESTSGVTVTITQNGAAVLLDVTGLTGGYLDFVFGNQDVWSGDVDGPHITAVREGTRAFTMGNCTFTYNATIEAHVTGDTMTGNNTYRPATNGNSDCAAVECANVQDFSGNRPPM